MTDHATRDDIAAAIVPKSDQVNADDMMSGPMDVQIAGTSPYRDQGANKVLVRLVGLDRVWKPCKTTLRVLVHCWGTDTHKWVGRWVRLYRDPTVRFGGEAVGGIRISHLSDIDGPQSIALTTTRGKRSMTVIQPLDAKGKTARRSLVEVLTDSGLTVADFDRWRSSKDRPPMADLTPQQCDQIAEWLASNPRALDEMRGPEVDRDTGETIPDHVGREPGEEG